MKPTRSIVIDMPPKDGHYYAVIVGERQIDQALQLVGRWAANPELNFGWNDAAHFSERIRAFQVAAKRRFESGGSQSCQGK